MNNYKSFSKLKEELGDNYDFKLYEMGISALKEIENLQQENKQLKEKLDWDLQWALKYEKQVGNWNKLKEYIRKNIIYDDVGMKILDPSPLEDYMQEIEQGSDSNE